MGVGKTTVGHIVADRLGRRFRDSDADLGHAHRNARRIARDQGIEALHRFEAELLLDALASPTPLVVAAAASVVEDPRALDALREPFVVWLHAPAAALVERLASADDHRRDLGADPAAALDELAEQRAPLYREVADASFDVTEQTPDEIAQAILDRFGADRRHG
jgi:shikimate kinase